MFIRLSDCYLNLAFVASVEFGIGDGGCPGMAATVYFPDHAEPSRTFRGPDAELILQALDGLTVNGGGPESGWAA